MIICGIDPGLLHTGFGIIEQQDNRLRYVACGTISAPTKAPLNERLAYIYDGLLQCLKTHHPDYVAVEEVFVARNAKIALTLGHVRGAILLAAAHSDLTVREFSSTLIKKSVVGYGRAEKSQIGTMVKILLPLAEPDSEHAADALAVAITCAHHHGALA